MNKALILYIEDNYDNRKLVSRVLQSEGYTVCGVEDGPAGLAFVQKKLPDLILIDLQLPGIDGYDVTRKLRQLDGLKKIPIVALSAYVLQEDKDRCFAAGCNGFINKPIDVDLITKEIETYLDSTHN